MLIKIALVIAGIIVIYLILVAWAKYIKRRQAELEVQIEQTKKEFEEAEANLEKLREEQEKNPSET